MAKESMDVEAAIGALNDALALQYRSAIAFSHVAAITTGLPWHGLVETMKHFAAIELEDARRLAEKITTLGGVPRAEVPAVEHHDEPGDMLGWLIQAETEAIEALQDVIPHTGQEGRSEALEHRLEHTIMRKQEQVDLLIRARG